MTVWAIVPVKPLDSAKSRLGKILNRDQRAGLSEEMLINTLEILGAVRQVERTLVVSRDPRALSLARDHGARTVSERGSPSLNLALVRASLVARGYGASAVLVLPADLPLLRQSDVENLISLAGTPPVVVIAPDRHHDGTNAILCSPPELIEYQFGAGSFERHIELTRQIGARLEICELDSLGFDLDVPEDLALIAQDQTRYTSHLQHGG